MSPERESPDSLGPDIEWLHEAQQHASYYEANGFWHGPVVFPTDTVYGLLGMTNIESNYRRIYELKGRDFSKPLALLIGRDGWIHKEIRRLIQYHELDDEFSCGKLTIVLPPEKVPMSLLSEIEIQPGSIGLRCPDHSKLQELLAAEEYGGAFWATSVNRSGEPPATTAEEVLAWLDSLTDEQRSLIGLVVLSREPGSGIPSRVVDLTGDEPRVLR